MVKGGYRAGMTAPSAGRRAGYEELGTSVGRDSETSGTRVVAVVPCVDDGAIEVVVDDVIGAAVAGTVGVGVVASSGPEKTNTTSTSTTTAMAATIAPTTIRCVSVQPS